MVKSLLPPSTKIVVTPQRERVCKGGICRIGLQQAPPPFRLFPVYFLRHIALPFSRRSAGQKTRQSWPGDQNTEKSGDLHGNDERHVHFCGRGDNGDGISSTRTGCKISRQQIHMRQPGKYQCKAATHRNQREDGTQHTWKDTSGISQHIWRKPHADAPPDQA